MIKNFQFIRYKLKNLSFILKNKFDNISMKIKKDNIIKIIKIFK